MDQLWTLAWFDLESGNQAGLVPPYDSNPGSRDEGMLVYRSFDAAKKSAEHQTELYGDTVSEARPVRLDHAIRRDARDCIETFDCANGQHSDACPAG